METEVNQIAGKFAWPNVCPFCGAKLAERWNLRNPQDYPLGQRCLACQQSIAFVPERLGEGQQRRIWWIPARPGDRFSRVSGKELLEASELEWEGFGGSAARGFSTLDPSGTLSPRKKNGRWQGRLSWRVPVTAGNGQEQITSIVLARGLLWISTLGGSLHLLNPRTGARARQNALNFRQDLMQDNLWWPPSVRGWWAGLSSRQALVIARLTVLAPDRQAALVPRQSLTPPAGSEWLSPPIPIDGGEATPLLFGCVSGNKHPLERMVSGGKLHLYDPSPMSRGEPPLEVAVVPIPDVAGGPIQVPPRAQVKLAGELLWVGADSQVHVIRRDGWTSSPLPPPPLKRRRLPYTAGNVALSLDPDELALWMVQADEPGRPMLRSFVFASPPRWRDYRELDARLGLDRACVSLHAYKPAEDEHYLAVSGDRYLEIFRRSESLTGSLNRFEVNQALADLTFQPRLLSPSILTPAGVVSLHPQEVRLTTRDPDQVGNLMCVAVDVNLAAPADSSFYHYAAACGTTLWSGTEEGAVVRVDFDQAP